MKTNSFYPVIMTEKLVESAAFYQIHFGFVTVFESDWYISLKLVQGDMTYELALLDPSHETIPAGYGEPTRGLLFNFEIDNVDDAYEKMIVKGKLPLLREIRDEDFGQRHFITCDPNGILIDIITIIPPSEEQSELYSEKVW
ncbi:VOC family protein [Paenibacillus sp. GSMTC-2017]|uniref:VOC family protein n=1 Tax=Paenibacillus sp. GSMTC-2017 TaxID=2794350 RepID=UPI0018D6D3E7|nr:VOC family protein [Paenibacillus sp. GSMTC-2017]MBH5318285.1 VOC family protein [Paenibacillus sp. GSMTC-2017]